VIPGGLKFKRTAGSPSLWSFLAGLVAMLVAAAATGVLSRPFDVPVHYAHDGLYFGQLIQNTLESGWYMTAPRLGFPFEGGVYDFPIGEYTNVLLVRLLSLVFGDFGSIYNAYYLLTFFLAAAVGSWVLGRLRVTPWLAAGGGIVFALLPYHFLRTHHLFLGAYWVVPLYVYLALRGVQGFRPGGPMVLGAWAVVLLLAGGSGVYYAFFGCLLIGVAALIEAVRRRSFGPMWRAGLWATPIVLGVAISLMPHFLYWKENGRNPESLVRSGLMSERYALKPIQLFLPTPGHRVPALAQAADRYKAMSSFTNDNQFAALGVLGSLALLVSLLSFFVGWPRMRSAALAGRYITMALLYAAVGGLGTVVAYTVLPEIRATNRISVFIGFLGALVLASVIQRVVARRRSLVSVRPLAVPAIAALLVGIAVFDQVPAIEYVRKDDVLADRAFFRQVEVALPPGAAVLQLPYVGFTEGRRVNGMDEYTHLRPYLNSRDLRFSFGVMKGRPGDRWYCAIHSLPPDRIAGAAAAAGFAAIMVATPGYADGGEELTAALRQTLGPPIAVGRGMAVFAIPPTMNAGASPLLTITRHEGFFGWEQWGPDDPASRATGNASVRLVSPVDARGAELVLRLRSETPRVVRVERQGAEIARAALEPNVEAKVPLRLDVRKGVDFLELKTDAPGTIPASDGSRPVTFRLAMPHCAER
jgi:phosphoglycerol transferase